VIGDDVHLLWQEAIGTIRGRYFILTRQELDAQTAKEWGAVMAPFSAAHQQPWTPHRVASGQYASTQYS
jgi:hypothetical protein